MELCAFLLSCGPTMSNIPPSLRPPTESEIQSCAREYHIDLTDEEVASFSDLLPDLLDSYERIDELDGRPDRASVPMTGNRNASLHDPESDPLNAWVTRCEVGSTADGPLSGYRVALKDNISLAGVPLTCGSRVLEGYTPDYDAPIVRRLLNDGATIVGKANMDDMAQAGSGELSASGPVLNPRDTTRLAGGSSSGGAAVVAADEADITVGTDQGGSARIPAAWCGCVGLKPTYGLVPYTGIVGVGHTLDHVGLLASDVRDCALSLDSIAGEDSLDPRQPVDSECTTRGFAAATTEDHSELVIGVVEEGFGREQSDSAVDECVLGALETLEDECDAVETCPVSIQWHIDALDIWTAVLVQEHASLVRDEGVGSYVRGAYDTDFAAAFAAGRRARGNQFQLIHKLILVLGEYLSETYHRRYYHRAQNLRRKVRAAYDSAIEEVDVLAMPTALTTAIEVRESASSREIFDRAFTVTNTAPFNLTGHPSISIPCGTVEGLPVGLMFTGSYGSDGSLLRATHAAEQTLS